jgi:O-antigen/teichoic acid export membrane protein
MALIVLPTTGAAVILAPEIIRILLGPQWDGVVDPFRVLALGMLLQNNNKIGDSLARALGAVYRRAWRQILYALLVVGGAYVGQHWGVVGVAWGVLLAIAVNFGLMTHLSLRLTGMDWLELWKAHLPGLRVAVLSSLLLWGSAVVLKSWVSSAVLILVAGLGTTAACTAAVIWLLPRLFLGPDGLWMVERLRAFWPLRSRAGRTPKGVPSYQPEHTGGAP